MLEKVKGAVCPTVDILFAQGGITEGTHNFLQEIGNVFDKSGCVLYKSSCVCLASEPGFWDVSSLMRTLYQELLFFLSFGKMRMACIRRC